ncbi:SDR family NAD(P)-dependent oxidoreductase [Streptomyces profundus]|uniref:SDR family NAD(P)-dependent oxidoreductase n=1 Tax=Streptomyces profundus TaxID=2867410 RepID=UPI001D16F564|nr:SDR family NAD(P)-dependent oxidoreductase [Streptomyces sp. MA3_2.13]UED82982.1 SDR family NAD(P)-dependent oxidoreductase [Streptomyces sp. MA3_2.13]
MTTIAIVGAGRGLGAAVARKFGSEGFDVALISRSQERVDQLAADLHAEGLTTRGYAANVRDPKSLIAALDAAAQELGPIEVLTYSPLPQKEFLRPVLETTADDLVGAVEFSIYGPVTAVHQVLQGQRFLGRESILFVNGGSGARPNPNVAGTSIAFAGESAYAKLLHDTLKDEHIQVGQLIIPGAITPGHPTHDPTVLADHLWHLHTHPDAFRVYADELPGAWGPTDA